MKHLPPLPWIHLSESIKPAKGNIRVVLDEIPLASKKVLAELYYGESEKPVTDPYQLLSPQYALSEREKACIQLFTQAEPFSLRRDRYVLTPRHLEALFLLQQSLSIEVSGIGSIAVEAEPAKLRGVLKTFDTDQLCLSFVAIESSGQEIEPESILGVHQALIIDAKLRLFHIDPPILPEEAGVLLECAPLPVSGLLHGDSKPVFEALVQIGVDLSVLTQAAEESDPKGEILLRAFLTSSGRSSPPTLRAHLVTTLNHGALSEEIEIPAKGILSPVHPLSDESDHKLSHEAINGVIVLRDHESEEKARNSLYELGLVASPTHRGFCAEGQRALDILGQLSRGEVDLPGITVDKELLTEITHIAERPRLLVAQAEGKEQGLLNLSLDFPFMKGGLNFEDILAVARKGGSAILIDDDHLLTFDQKAAEALAWLGDTLEFKNSDDKLQLSFLETAFLLRASQEHFDFSAKKDLMTRLETFIPELTPEDHQLPAMLKTQLRPYQAEALTWLSQLHRASLGRLLADDMGLGKTIMVLSLLAKTKEIHGQKASLVVAPTSVIDVWVEEAHKHFSDLKAIKWHGPDRAQDIDAMAEADLVVTSYALLRRDAANILSKRDFRYLILDEAQNVKNPRTESWKSAASILSEQRLALTGTPIENRLLDLFSIVSLVSPGVLGTERSFTKRYAQPIQSGNVQRAIELRERIRPIVLRRKKSDVEKDLPPKIENVMRCDMSPEQRALYRQILKAAKDDLGIAMSSPMSNRSRMPFLAAITRLRQICCDPRLIIDPQEAHFPSAKAELFEEALLECLSMGRRMIIYSQFIKMQEIILQILKKNGVEDALWLHGGSKNRDQIVSRFQDPDGPKAIVVSLKAGGTGITLTAADTIIYYDLWWNPAVLDQAADRAHRIGQTKAVHLIKLICSDTIEEQILALSEKKRALAEGALVADMPGQRSLTLEDIHRLLTIELEREHLDEV